MGYSNFPNSLDDSLSIPISTDLVTEVKAEVVNRHRDAIISIETTLGTSPQSTYASVKDRLNSIESTVSTLAPLNGDLGGTSDSVKVIGLQGRSILDSTPPISGDVLTYNGTQWFYLPFGGAEITPIGPASGDLSGSYPSPLVSGIQGIEVSSTSPLDGYSLVYDLSSDMWIPAQVSTDPATTTSLGTIQLSNDLGGTATSPDVLKIHGATVPAAIGLTTGNVLKVSGSTSLSYGQLDISNSNSVTGILHVTSGGNYGNPFSFMFFPGIITTASSSDVVAATLRFDKSILPGTFTIFLKVIAETTGPLASFSLYNFTAAAAVTGTSLSTSSTTPVILTTSDIASNLSAGEAIYQLYANMAAGSASDQINVDSVEFLVTWS